VLVALVDHGSTSALILLAVIIAVQQLEGNVLYPVVMRRAVDVHPVAILLGVAAGGIIAGVLGAIIAVPVVAVIGRVLALLREEQEGAGNVPEDAGAVLLDPEGGRRFMAAQDALTAGAAPPD